MLRNKLISLGLLSILLFSCTKEEEAFIPLCPDGECDAIMQLPYPQDSEGNYLVDLDWDGEYWPRFDIEVLAEETSPEYWYNGEPHIIAEFDTDSYWVMGDSLSITFPLYKPWVGLETQWGDPIPVGEQTIYLSQFQGQILPLVQKSEILFNNGYSKRIVGPVPREFENDTIKIFMKVTWDGGVTTETKTYEENFIVF
tara:strand:+ start:174 stop:767 length:594 start_codon:yes stop_codon:yes gene_type:complete